MTKKTETVHKVERRLLSPGETIQGYGFTPAEILTTRDATYERDDGYGSPLQEELVRVWFLVETEIEVDKE